MEELLPLRNEERAAFSLRALYRQYGYNQFKMNKFEEYDLYMKNKDFLISEGVITFTDTNGKLMALKPDVTLSIIKNSKDEENTLQKVFYHENVYRVSARSHAFEEIVQVGLECIGKIDRYAVLEVLSLAAASLRKISWNCVLDISHVGIISAVIDALCVDEKARKSLMKCIGEKNTHELLSICKKAGAKEEAVAVLLKLVKSYGKPSAVLPLLSAIPEEIVPAAIISPFTETVKALEATGYGDIVRVDFSVVNDINYYNGIVFKGFVDGVPGGVLSGGQYDRLMRKMGRSAGAIGFAVYLDMLERLSTSPARYDVETLVLYDDDADPAALSRAVQGLAGNGSVSVQREKPPRLRCKTCLKFDGKEGTFVETDA